RTAPGDRCVARTIPGTLGAEPRRPRTAPGHDGGLTMQADDRYGVLEQREDGWLVTFGRELNHPREQVWRAIDEQEPLAKWFPSTIDGERRAGARLTFRFPEDDGGMVMEGEMIAFEPQHLMELTWGEDRVRIELAPRGSGTTLVLKALMQE